MNGSFSRLRCIVFLAIFLMPRGTSGQVDPPPPPGSGPVSVVPAEHCTASGFFKTLAGAGYRHLWATPIQIPVADMGTLGGGGLTPLRVGGGVTTQTLHMRGEDGRRYVFRSVQKTTRQALAEEFWGTPVEAIMRDQLCSFHPSGAVIVSRLLDAVGVLHPEPEYLIVPDDPRLGEFREQFRGMLVLFEERPDDLPDGQAGFAGSRRIVQIEDLFEALEDDPEDRVQVEELMRSRLVDLLVGDRDRSINNHLWARIDLPGGGDLWRPIPRDRDQSFVRFDGAVKRLGRYYDHRLVSFGEDYPDIHGLTRNAWDIDRNLLVGVERGTWDRIVAEVQAALTDEVIADAVAQMPREHLTLVGEELRSNLRNRRDRLPEAAEVLYGIIFGQADVHGTDEDEAVVIEGLPLGRLKVVIRPRESDQDQPDPPHFHRTFAPDETKEIRLYLHGGDDLVRVEGEVEPSILVRLIGGGGRDEVANVSGRRRVILYDEGNGSRLEGEGTKWVERDVPRIYSWWVEGEGQLDWGSENLPLPNMSYDQDRGLVLGFGVRHDRFGFLKRPFNSRHRVRGGWAVGRNEPILDIFQYLQSRIGEGDLALHARYSGIEIVRFYGLGNETVEVEEAAFYKVFQKQFVLEAGLSFGDGDRRHLSFGPVLRYTSSDTSNPSTLLADARPYGTGRFWQSGIRAAFELDTRDIKGWPTRGYRLEGEAAFYPELLDLTSSFSEVHGEAAVYASLPSGNPTLAVRAGGKKLWGTFPYSDAAFLGGSDDLRGLREQRFAGNASVHGSAELRLFLTRFFLLFPFDFGVFGLADTGRVFADGESSDRWHQAWGGGLWFAPLNRDATVRLSMARSGERTSIYAGMGFGF